MRLRMAAGGSILFSFELIYREGEGPPQIGTLTKTRSAADLHASRDSLYRTARARRQVRSGLPRPETVKPADTRLIRGPGLVFERQEFTGSVWLMKLLDAK